VKLRPDVSAVLGDGASGRRHKKDAADTESRNLKKTKEYSLAPIP